MKVVDLESGAERHRLQGSDRTQFGCGGAAPATVVTEEQRRALTQLRLIPAGIQSDRGRSAGLREQGTLGAHRAHIAEVGVRTNGTRAQPRVPALAGPGISPQS